MIRLAKLVFYALCVAAVAFLYWFLPKYSFVQKNPGYCVNLSRHLYYCGDKSSIDSLFKPGQ